MLYEVITIIEKKIQGSGLCLGGLRMLSNPGRGAGVGAKESAGENSDSNDNEKEVTGECHQEANKHGHQAKPDRGGAAMFFYQFVDRRGAVGAKEIGKKDQADRTLAEPSYNFV